MPITLTPFSHSNLFHGSSWTIQDETKLAQQIAHVALGQSQHIAKILAGAELAPLPVSSRSINAAIAMLTLEADEEPFHRDGWMFQVISWLAALKATPNAICTPPHMRFAHKGFDGVQLVINSSNGVIDAVVIFEDKATVNPRSTIRSEVWPALSKLEAGERENELVADVSGLLATLPNVDADAAIRTVIWDEVRHYRVSITISDKHVGTVGHKRLFKGYDDIATGPIKRRRGETFLVPNLRLWMSGIAMLAIGFLEEML